MKSRTKPISKEIVVRSLEDSILMGFLAINIPKEKYNNPVGENKNLQRCFIVCSVPISGLINKYAAMHDAGNISHNLCLLSRAMIGDMITRMKSVRTYHNGPMHVPFHRPVRSSMPEKCIFLDNAV